MEKFTKLKSRTNELAAFRQNIESMLDPTREGGVDTVTTTDITFPEFDTNSYLSGLDTPVHSSSYVLGEVTEKEGVTEEREEDMAKTPSKRVK